MTDKAESQWPNSLCIARAVTEGMTNDQNPNDETNAARQVSVSSFGHSDFVIDSGIRVSSFALPWSLLAKAYLEPCSLELLVQIPQRQAQRGGPAVGAVARAFDQLAAGQQGFDLGGGKRVTGLDGGLAAHHV